MVAPDASAAEHEAAQLLAEWCGKLHAGSDSAPPLPVVAPGLARQRQFAVGVAASAALGLTASDVARTVLGPDGYVLTSNRTSLLRGSAAGSIALSGAPNSTGGALNAAQKLLGDSTALSPLPLISYTNI